MCICAWQRSSPVCRRAVSCSSSPTQSRVKHQNHHILHACGPAQQLQWECTFTQHSATTHTQPTPAKAQRKAVLFNHESLSSITKCSRYIWRHISMMRGYGQALLYGRELCAIWGTGRSGACRPPRVIPPRQPNRGKTLAMHKPPAARLYGAGVGYSWTWTSILPRSVRAISHSSVLHADAQSEEVSLHWSGSFDGKLKMLMMEATALGRELCENPTPDRQAVIGLVCSRPC